MAFFNQTEIEGSCWIQRKSRNAFVRLTKGFQEIAGLWSNIDFSAFRVLGEVAGATIGITTALTSMISSMGGPIIEESLFKLAGFRKK